MVNIELTPEIARLSQHKARRQRVLLQIELARVVAEQAVMQLDPQLNFLLESEDSLSEIDSLVEIVGVNDIVVNGRHIDVRLLDEMGRVKIDAALLETPYIQFGSLVVQMTSTTNGAVIGHIAAKNWHSALNNHAGIEPVNLPFVADRSFDLARVLTEIDQEEPESHSTAKAMPKAEYYIKFLKDRQSVSLGSQRQIVAAATASAMIRENIRALSNLTDDQTPRILRQSGIWEGRVAGIVAMLSAKFNDLSESEIETAVRQVGENFGGQPEEPKFKEALIAVLVKRKLKQVKAEKANKIVDLVLSGRSALEAVSQFIKNQIALDVAKAISEKRKRFDDFALATQDEIAFAFKHLALQPAYATHSQAEEAGIASINDALALLQAGQLIEELQAIDF